MTTCPVSRKIALSRVALTPLIGWTCFRLFSFLLYNITTRPISDTAPSPTPFSPLTGIERKVPPTTILNNNPPTTTTTTTTISINNISCPGVAGERQDQSSPPPSSANPRVQPAMTTCPTQSGSSTEIILICLHPTTLPLKPPSASVPPPLLLQSKTGAPEHTNSAHSVSANGRRRLGHSKSTPTLRPGPHHASYACVASRLNLSSCSRQKQIS